METRQVQSMRWIEIKGNKWCWEEGTGEKKQKENK
jgi:hypothetical protein